MKVEQVSVFLENKPGSLEEVTRILKEANINIRTLSLADTTDFGILRLIVNNVDTTSRVLRDNGFRVSRTTVDAVEVPALLGRSSRELKESLGAAYEGEVVHRDDVVLL